MTINRCDDKTNLCKQHFYLWCNFSHKIKVASSHSPIETWRQVLGDIGLAKSNALTGLKTPNIAIIPNAIATLKGYQGGVDGALALKDNQEFLSWSDDPTLRPWDKDGARIKTLKGHKGGVNGALALADNQGFLSWSDDNTLRLWDRHGECIKTLEGHEKGVVGALALADNQGFLSWGEDGTLRLWDEDGNYIKTLKGHQGKVEGALALKDNQGFLSWGEDGILRLWDRHGNGVNQWLCLTGAIHQVCPLDNDDYVVVSGEHVHNVHLSFPQ